MTPTEDVDVRLAKLMLLGRIEVSLPLYPEGLLSVLLGEEGGAREKEDPRNLMLRMRLEHPGVWLRA